MYQRFTGLQYGMPLSDVQQMYRYRCVDAISLLFWLNESDGYLIIYNFEKQSKIWCGINSIPNVGNSVDWNIEHLHFKLISFLNDRHQICYKTGK